MNLSETMLADFSVQHKGYDTSARADLSGYADQGSVGPYALEAMQWAVGAKLINGKTATTLVPGGEATRAEAAVIFRKRQTSLHKKAPRQVKSWRGAKKIKVCRQQERSRATETERFSTVPSPSWRQRIRAMSDSGRDPSHSQRRSG